MFEAETIVIPAADLYALQGRKSAERDLQAQVLRQTLAQIDLSGLRAELAKRDRTRGWLA